MHSQGLKLSKRHSAAGKVPGSPGYTLIEMAIVITVLGVLFAAFAGAYSLYLKSQVQEKTVSNVGRVVSALGSYLMQTGAYPCPAPLDVSRDDSDYGRAHDTECRTPTILPGACSGGLCVEEGDNTVDVSQTDSPLLEQPRVIRGAVPFRTLGLPESISLDGHNSRLFYAVTANLAVTESYKKEAGGVSIVDDQNNSVIVPAGSAHFVVFSAGPDLVGAYSREGRLITACAAIANSKDAINCNTDNTADGRKAHYRHMGQVRRAGTDYYDDHMRFYSSVETPLWRVADKEALHIRDLIDAESGGRIGVGTNVPAATMDIFGDILAREGSILAANLCDHQGNDCFNPELIGGDLLHCPPGYVATGIGHSALSCAPEVEIKCPIGQILTGLNGDGEIICTGTTGCPPKTIPLCPDPDTNEIMTYLLPSGLQNQQSPIIPFGINGETRYVCNNGEWTEMYRTGGCTCPSGVSEEIKTCNEFKGTGFWTGTATNTVTLSCDPPSSSETGWVHNCECRQDASTVDIQAPGVNGGGDACPPNQTGKKGFRRDWTCSNVNAGSWSAKNYLPEYDTCACPERLTEKGKSCPEGHVGTNGYSTASGWRYNEWYELVGANCTLKKADILPLNCECVDGMIKELSPVACGEGQSGQKTRLQRFNCSLNQWGPVEEDSSQCYVALFTWQKNGETIGPGSGTPATGSTCPSAGQTGNCTGIEGGVLVQVPCICQ